MNQNNFIKIIVVVLIIFFLFLIFRPKNINEKIQVHEHVIFKVFINGEELNFAHPEYMVRDKDIHIENMNGATIHKHASGKTLGDFFKSILFKFNKNCFVFDDGDSYCNSDGKILKFYVNDNKNFEYGDYEIRDNDRILISYGNDSEEEIKEQLDSII